MGYLPKQPAGLERAAYMGTGGDSEKTQFQGQPPELIEFGRLDKAMYRQMVPGRLQVLAKGQQLATGLTNILESLQHFISGFAKTEHQS